MTGAQTPGIHTGQGGKVLDTVLGEPHPDAAVLQTGDRLHLQFILKAGEGVVQRLHPAQFQLQFQGGIGILRLLRVGEKLCKGAGFQLRQ